jgi:hypothetical protein
MFFKYWTFIDAEFFQPCKTGYIATQGQADLSLIQSLWGPVVITYGFSNIKTDYTHPTPQCVHQVSPLFIY